MEEVELLGEVGLTWWTSGSIAQHPAARTMDREYGTVGTTAMRPMVVVGSNRHASTDHRR